MFQAIVWLMACQPEEVPPPPNVDAALSSVVASLEEAARLDVASQDEDARSSWRRAHTEFESDIEPTLRTVLTPPDVATIELRFGLFRAALEQKRGSSSPQLRRLRAALQDAGVAVHEAEVEPDGTEATPDPSSAE